MFFHCLGGPVKFGVYLGVKTCEVFLCFFTIIFLVSIVFSLLFSLFYVVRECNTEVFTPRMSRNLLVTKGRI